MIKVYIGKILENTRITEVLLPSLNITDSENLFGEKVFDGDDIYLEIVKDIFASDYICIPHNYNYIMGNIDYLNDFIVLSEKYNKRILIFSAGDSDSEIPVPNSIIFRNSQYGYKKKINEIISPGYAVDLGSYYGHKTKNKSDKPIVGFCGWAKYKTFKEYASYCVNLMSKTFKSYLGDKDALLFRKGLYFRRVAISILQKNPNIISNFILRSSYGGNAKTIGISAKEARKEFLKNIDESDFILAPKGDGNFSVRLYEALSMARIPILIDTDCPLPLSDLIDYSKIVLKIDYRDIDKIDKKIISFYNSISNEEFIAIQKRCREVYEKYLKLSSFFKIVLTHEFLEKIPYTK